MAVLSFSHIFQEKYPARSAQPLKPNNYQVPTMKKRQDLRWNVRVHLNTIA